jgi:N utilization substance protein B
VSPGAVIAELPVNPDSFTIGLVVGVGSDQDRIDSLISAHAIGWAMDRMPVVDRALLRIGTYELLAHEDVPTAVIISEAVDLATQYSTDESGRFVNGVLAAIATDVRGNAGSAESEAGGSSEGLGSSEVVGSTEVLAPPDPPNSSASLDSSGSATSGDRVDPPA